MNILVIGGNSFFGKHLVKKLISNNHKITLLNRGNKDDGFGTQVKRFICDRNDPSKLESAVGNCKWDIIYDQVCYDYNQAKQAVKIFSDCTKKYIFTSSMSVYDAGTNICENVFDPYSYKPKNTVNQNYGEAKRQAEAAFFQNANFAITAVRFPIVFGLDDPTHRFQFHIEHIKKQKPIYFPNFQAKLSLISADSAADALIFLGTNSYTGPINVACKNPLTLEEFVFCIEEKMKNKAILTSKPNNGDQSPYGVAEDWYMDCNNIGKLGFCANDIKTEILASLG